MARRPTVADIAAVSGLSVATVDRVLNARLPVKQDTSERVLKAAEQVGYHASGLIRRRLEAGLPHYRMHFLLQRPDQIFYADFARELERAALAPAEFRVSATVGFLASQTPSEIASRLRDAARSAQAIAMVAIDHPAVTAAVAEVEAAGIPVFSLLSDFASGVRRGYIGTDNTKVGRTAAWLIARAARPGKVAVFVGSHRFHGHEMREIGFRSYLRQSAPHLAVIDTLVNLEDITLAHEATSDLLRHHPDVTGIYVAGGGMEGVVAALREENMAGHMAVVCNEINALSRAALAENLITALTATPVSAVAQNAITLMAAAIAGRPSESGGQTFLPFDIFVSENI
jgi:LacI family transcriptional regulator